VTVNNHNADWRSARADDEGDSTTEARRTTDQAPRVRNQWDHAREGYGS